MVTPRYMKLMKSFSKLQVNIALLRNFLIWKSKFCIRLFKETLQDKLLYLLFTQESLVRLEEHLIISTLIIFLIQNIMIQLKTIKMLIQFWDLFMY